MQPLPARPFIVALLALLLSAATACGSRPLLSNVTIAPEVITPSTNGGADTAIIRYAVGQPARVSIVLTDAAGREYHLRRGEPRPPGQYEARFTGTYAPDETRPDRRVLPSGRYASTVVAEAEDGTTAQARGVLEIRDADTTPPRIEDVTVLPAVISPNGDRVDDEAQISYALTKDAWVTVLVEGEDGTQYLLEAETEQRARRHSLRWNGTAGERLLPDGVFTLHIRARDAAGNITSSDQPITVVGSSRPRLELTAVRFSPLVPPVGDAVTIEITVKNAGETPLRSLAPLFTLPEAGELFTGVGAAWEGADRPSSIRWSWDGTPLLPGEEVTITGVVQVSGIRREP
ncbi:MAG: hypothetical protein HY689_16050 [Chloroflexi bacterium]|nr:hypothetical protein [Chloroflexota bacterium]